jgi:DNA-binding transcriptional LysR family regulator
MNTDQVSHFVAVARTGSVTAAAREQHISQPALSRSIQHLEEDLGVTLFDRGKNSLELNRVGRELLPHAEELLAAERRMRRVSLDASRREHVLSVGTIAPAPLWYLTSLIVERMPGALVSSEMVGDEADVERALFDSLINLAICTRKAPGMRSVLLMRENLYLSAPKDHPLAQRENVSFEELDGETFLLFGGIGFWGDMHRRMTPHAHMVVQEDREVWRQLMRTTRMLGFSSDAPVLMRPDVVGEAEGGEGQVERVFVPIRDSEAHATFYLCAREDAYAGGGLVRAVMDLAEELGAGAR